MIYTAQYRYPGKDRLDITVKGNAKYGGLFAPTWPMVRDVKNGKLPEDWYEETYYDLLCDRWKTRGQEMMKLVEIACHSTREITVVCFCPANTFCHRHLLIKFLKHNYPIIYGGERTGF